jgi:hypothetical protein
VRTVLASPASKLATIFEQTVDSNGWSASKY